MRDFLINFCPVIIAAIAVSEAVLTVLLFMIYVKKQQSIALIMAIVGAGLLFDAFVMGLGAFMPEGILRVLNRVRYVSHGLLIPMNIAICGYGMRWFDIKLKIVWSITAVLCILGCVAGSCRVLELRDFAGIIRYVAADTTPVWADKINRIISYGTVIPIILVGIYVWIKERTPTFFLAGALMFVFAMLGPITGNIDLIFLISMFGEVLMLLFFYLYAKQNAEIQ